MQRSTVILLGVAAGLWWLSRDPKKAQAAGHKAQASEVLFAGGGSAGQGASVSIPAIVIPGANGQPVTPAPTPAEVAYLRDVAAYQNPAAPIAGAISASGDPVYANPVNTAFSGVLSSGSDVNSAWAPTVDRVVTQPVAPTVYEPSPSPVPPVGTPEYSAWKSTLVASSGGGSSSGAAAVSYATPVDAAFAGAYVSSDTFSNVDKGAPIDYSAKTATPASATSGSRAGYSGQGGIVL